MAVGNGDGAGVSVGVGTAVGGWHRRLCWRWTWRSHTNHRSDHDGTLGNETLRARILSGLGVPRRNAKVLGRRKGSKLSRAAFLKKHPDIIRLLRSGQSVRNTAKIADNSASTVQKVKASLGKTT